MDASETDSSFKADLRWLLENYLLDITLDDPSDRDPFITNTGQENESLYLMNENSNYALHSENTIDPPTYHQITENTTHLMEWNFQENNEPPSSILLEGDQDTELSFMYHNEQIFQDIDTCELFTLDVHESSTTLKDSTGIVDPLFIHETTIPENPLITLARGLVLPTQHTMTTCDFMMSSITDSTAYFEDTDFTKRRKSTSPDFSSYDEKEYMNEKIPKTKEFLERNRQAASKSRKRKKILLKDLQQKLDYLSARNKELKLLKFSKSEEVRDLKRLLIVHKDCNLQYPDIKISVQRPILMKPDMADIDMNSSHSLLPTSP